MLCAFSNPLSEDDIDATLDGVASDSVREHLAKCPFCAQQVAEARKVEQMLMERLYRWRCPPSKSLGDYHVGLVNADEGEGIAEHVRGCAACQAELDELRAFLDVETVQPVKATLASLKPEPQRMRLGEIIARLLPQQLSPAIRGADSGPQMAEADGLTIFIELQVGERGLALLGQLAAQEPEVWTSSLVELRQAGVLQATTELDDLGSFRC